MFESSVDFNDSQTVPMYNTAQLMFESSVDFNDSQTTIELPRRNI